jgi:hypothetical protein
MGLNSGRSSKWTQSHPMREIKENSKVDHRVYPRAPHCRSPELEEYSSHPPTPFL